MPKWTPELAEKFKKIYGTYPKGYEPKEVKPLTVPQRIDTSAQAIAEGRQVSSADSQLVKASGSKALNKIVFGEAPKTEAQQLDSVKKYWGARISVMKNQALSKIMEGKGTAKDTSIAFPGRKFNKTGKSTSTKGPAEYTKRINEAVTQLAKYIGLGQNATYTYIKEAIADNPALADDPIVKNQLDIIQQYSDSATSVQRFKRFNKNAEQGFSAQQEVQKAMDFYNQLKSMMNQKEADSILFKNYQVNPRELEEMYNALFK